LIGNGVLDIKTNKKVMTLQESSTFERAAQFPRDPRICVEEDVV